VAAAGAAAINGENHATMETIARETGGRAYYNTNDLAGSMVEAFNDGSNYYSLSYVPSNQKWDGRFRKMKVEVDRPSSKLYYREGYYAEEPGALKHSFPVADTSMRSAMLRGSPAVSGITFQMHLKPEGPVHVVDPKLKSRKDQPSSQLTGTVQHYTFSYIVSRSEIQFSSTPSNLYRCNLALSAIAYDEDGKMLNASIGQFNMPLNSTVYAAVQRDALHITGAIDLPPGKVYLRVGIHDLAADKIGSFEIPVDVPKDASNAVAEEVSTSK
jgi:hypothetical protein